MVTYKTLNQIHPSIDLDETRDRRALYAGGAAIKARAGRILHQRPAEPEAIYAARLREMQYRPYLSAIVDHFAALIFGSKPSAVPTRNGREIPEVDFYSQFKGDCDRAGTNVDAAFKALFVDACVAGTAWLRLHAPRNDGEPAASLADFDQRGLGEFWIERLDGEAVLDWETDAHGNLEWVIVHRMATVRSSPTGLRDTVVETWDVCDREHVQTFGVRYRADDPPKPDTEIESIDITAHPFGCVPLLCMRLADGQHLGARLESPMVAHTVALNMEAWSLSRCAFAMPVFTLEDRRETPTMGTGWSITLGRDEKAEWLEPAGTHLDALDRTIRAHKDELFRVATVMALATDNAGASIGRSAESKLADTAASRIAMMSFADRVRDEMSRLYTLISSARGEDVTWEIQGLDDFDVSGFLDAMQKLRDAADGLHSPTARAALETRAVEALLPDQKAETKHRIRQEISDGITNEPTAHERELEQLTHMHTLAGAA